MTRKFKAKLKVLFLITLGFIFALAPLLTSNLIISGVNSDTGDDVINIDHNNLRSSKISGKIHIDGNSEWLAFKNDGNCTGSGTWSDPYVIRDLVIDGEGSGSCIWIENSDAYFIVRNCSLYNSSSSSDNAGIKLYNVDNGKIINNNCSDNNNNGIYLGYSNNNTILGNNLSNNNYGIYLFASINNNLSGNLMNFCGIYLSGFLLYLASHSIDNTNLVNNKPVYYYVNELGLGSSNFTNAGQIILINCSNSIISGFNLSNGTTGIYLGYSNNNTLSGNTASNNNVCGIYLVYSDNNTLLGNTARNSNIYGIYLAESNNNTLSGNNACNNNHNGISLWYNSDNNTLSGNDASNNDYFGIILSSSDNNTLSGNTASNNSWCGISLDTSNNNTISGNIASNGLSGIYLDSSNNNTLSGNTANNNSYGIKLSLSNNNKIVLNNFTNNENDALDDGINNRWDNGTVGNYWDDYPGRDSNDNGIGDTPYTIPGSAGSQDNFPIWWDAPVFSLNSPSQNEYFSINPPNFDISIEEGVVNSTWYTLDGDIINKTFTGLTGTIDQVLWDSISEGDVTIRFYANDTRGNMAFEEVTINKDTTAPIITINSPSTDEIFGNNAPGYNLTIIEPNIDTMWYTLDGGTTNFTFTGLTGTIDQTIWDSVSEGDVTIRFYVMDSAGYISFEEIEVVKRIPEADGIPGYNLFFLLGTISVVAIVISAKLKKFNK